MVLQMLTEAKAFDAAGRPEIQAIIDTLNNKTAVSQYALDQGVTYGSAELAIIQGKAFLAGVDETSQSVLEAKMAVDVYKSGASAFTVAQIETNAHGGGTYHLADTLKNIAAADAIRAAAADFKITNWPGTVGAATVHEAEVLQEATNGKEYDYSLADSQQVIKAASVSIIAEADTIAVVGTDLAETMDFSNFSRGVILNGHGNADNMTGSKFNDTLYGGTGANFYCGGGGRDSFYLDNKGTDTVFLTKLASGGSFEGATAYVFGFGSDDDVKIAQSDVSANLQGNFTPDDYFTFAANGRSSASYIANYVQQMHGVGVVEFEGELSAAADLGRSSSSAELLLGLGGKGTSSDYLSVHAGWDGFLIAYDNDNKAYIYYASDDGDGKMKAPEITLIGVVQPEMASSANWMTSEHFIL